MSLEAPDFLTGICSRKRNEISDAKELLPLARIEASARETDPPRDFAAAIEQPGISLIAEIKRASPSKGDLAPGLDPGAIAAEYEEAGAAAISVLTDEVGFGGTLEDLSAVRSAATVPLLRKDFILDAYQVAEARAAGADAVLLIVAALAPAELEELIEAVEDWGMTPLVEVHDAAELGRALDAGARVVGVNNRDLRSFEVSLGCCLELAEQIPDWITAVAESGISTRADVELVEAAGYEAVLVGESLVSSGSVRAAIDRLLGRE